MNADDWNVDDWDAEDWDLFWSEPEEGDFARGVEDASLEAVDDLDDGLDPWSEHTEISAFESAKVPQNTSMSAPSPKSTDELEHDFQILVDQVVDPWIAINEAAILRRAKRPWDAIRLTVAIRTKFGGKAPNKSRSALLTTTAASYLDLRMNDFGRATAKRAIDFDPENYRAWRVQGRALRYLGRHGAADAAFEKAQELEAAARRARPA